MAEPRLVNDLEPFTPPSQSTACSRSAHWMFSDRTQDPKHT